MASRRRLLGEAITNTGGSLLDYVLRLKAQENQSSLVGKRQQELAEQNQEFRRGQAEDARTQKDREMMLGDPTGGVAQTMLDAGDTSAAPFVPSGEIATTRLAAGLDSVSKREDLASDVGLENRLGAAPGGRQAAKDPRAIEQLIAARNAKRGTFDQADTSAVTQQRATAFAEGEGRGAGTEAAAAAAFPAQLGRKTTEFKTMTPLEVSRAGKTATATATAQQSALTRGEADRTRQSWELAAQDPVIAGIAGHVIDNPEQLAKVPAAQRGYVMAALKSDKFRPKAVVRAKELLDNAYNAVQRMKGNQGGMEGAVGLRITDPSRWGWGGADAPMGGTAAGDFQGNFNQLKGALTLEKVDYLRGTGSMSDGDRIVLTSASTHLGNNLSEGAFSSGLDETEQALLRQYKALGVEPPMATETPQQSAERKFNQLQSTMPGVRMPR